MTEKLLTKTLHPAAVQNERQRTKIYQIGPPSAIQAGRCGRMARVYKKFTNLILFTYYLFLPCFYDIIHHDTGDCVGAS